MTQISYAFLILHEEIMKYKLTYNRTDWQTKFLYLILILLSTLACTVSIDTISTDTEPASTQELALITLSRSPTPEATASLTPAFETMCEVRTGLEMGLLNLRDGPSTSYSSLYVLHEGDQLTFLRNPSPDGWINIRHSSFVGWVDSNYVKCEKEQ